MISLCGHVLPVVWTGDEQVPPHFLALELWQIKSEFHGRFFSGHKSPHFCEGMGHAVSHQFRSLTLAKNETVFPFPGSQFILPKHLLHPDICKTGSCSPALFEEAITVCVGTASKCIFSWSFPCGSELHPLQGQVEDIFLLDRGRSASFITQFLL